MPNVKEMVREFLLRDLVLDGDESLLGDDTNLLETGIVDSFSIFTLASFLEKHFQIRLEVRDMAHGGLSSLSEIERLVESRVGVQP